MRILRVLWILGVLLALTPLANADGTTTMQLNGPNGANDGTYYVSPYYGTMNYGTTSAQSVNLFCDDMNNEVSMNQVWTANVTSLSQALATNNFSNTRYGNSSVNTGLSSNPYASNPGMLYMEAAWIATQFSSHSGDYVSLQYALWDLMTPGAEATSYSNGDGVTVAQWLAMAGQYYTSTNPANFTIITNIPRRRAASRVLPALHTQGKCRSLSSKRRNQLPCSCLRSG